jgi:hypothetical protein
MAARPLRKPPKEEPESTRRLALLKARVPWLRKGKARLELQESCDLVLGERQSGSEFIFNESESESQSEKN